MIPEYCLRVDAHEVASGSSLAWTEEMLADAKRRACAAIAAKGKKVLTCDFAPCGSGWVRAVSSDIFGPGTFCHPSAVATVYRDGTIIG